VSLLVAYRALGLGDFLTGVPALRALARAFPEHRLVLAAPRSLAPLAALSGAVDELVDTAPLAPLPPALHGADVAVNLHGRGPESHRVLLAARPRRLIAFGDDGPRWRAGEHEIARWCRLLEESGIPADPDDLALPPPPRAAPATAVGATVIHPGAGSAARRWPPERWAAVARAEAAAGRRVALTGGPDERALALEVAAAAGLPSGQVLAGRTDLADLAAAVAAAARVACGDTGVAHLATAYRVPSVLLFGPTSPDEWGPPPGRAWHRVLWAGRRGDPHADAPDPGLLAIDVEQVVAALRTVPAREAAGSTEYMSLIDKLKGRFKKAAGDLADDASMRREGRRDERKGEVKEERERAHEQADRKSRELADLERRS
jgi:ADP-heptose:LPS heptosyltransferase